MVKPRSPKIGKWKVNKGRNKNPTLKPMFDYLLNKYTQDGLKDRDVKRPRYSMSQGHREQLKQTKPEAKEKRVAEEKYNLKIS
jgi:hypothetical protein